MQVNEMKRKARKNKQSKRKKKIMGLKGTEKWAK